MCKMFFFVKYFFYIETIQSLLCTMNQNRNNLSCCNSLKHSRRDKPRVIIGIASSEPGTPYHHSLVPNTIGRRVPSNLINMRAHQRQYRYSNDVWAAYVRYPWLKRPFASRLPRIDSGASLEVPLPVAVVAFSENKLRRLKRFIWNQNQFWKFSK